MVFAHGEGVEHGGDPGGHDLRVVREERGHALRPDHLGAGDEMFFEVVGVQLHKAGEQVVAFQIDAFVEGGDVAVADKKAPFHDRVGRDQPGVGEYGFVHIVIPLGKSLRALHGDGAVGHGFTGHVVMEDAHNGGSGLSRLTDQIDDHLPVRAVQRGGGLVEQEDR